MFRSVVRGLTRTFELLLLGTVTLLLAAVPALAHHETLRSASASTSRQATVAVAGSAVGSTTTAYTAAEQQMWVLINQERTRAGLAPLRLDATLTALARLKSQDMVERNYFSHYSPTYGYPYAMEYRAGIRARYMGAENIAAAASVQVAHALLMASPGHRRNILDPRFTDVGVGVAPGRWGVIVTQLFIGR